MFQCIIYSSVKRTLSDMCYNFNVRTHIINVKMEMCTCLHTKKKEEKEKLSCCFFSLCLFLSSKIGTENALYEKYIRIHPQLINVLLFTLEK